MPSYLIDERPEHTNSRNPLLGCRASCKRWLAIEAKFSSVSGNLLEALQGIGLCSVLACSPVHLSNEPAFRFIEPTFAVSGSPTGKNAQRKRLRHKPWG